jgi:hypothetical protein
MQSALSRQLSRAWMLAAASESRRYDESCLIPFFFETTTVFGLSLPL